MRRNLKVRSSAPVAPARAPGRILVPLDFSACSLHTLRHALMLARPRQAEIVLVHIVEPLHPGSMLEGSETRRLHNLAVREAEHRLAELARTSVRPLAPVRYLVRVGKPFAVIAELARKPLRTSLSWGHTATRGFPRSCSAAPLSGWRAARTARC